MKFVYRICAGFIFILLLPLMAGIVGAIAVTSGFPVVFRQKRVGKGGRIFTLYKFRSMVPQAEEVKPKLVSINEATGPVFKIRHDPRFTPVGKLLSHTGLDELPQLYNMMKGDMVFFGPRPLPVFEAKKLAAWMRKRERIMPGIISPAVLTGTYHRDFESWMRSDVEYVQTKSIRHDTRLLIRLVPFVIRMVLRSVRTGPEA